MSGLLWDLYDAARLGWRRAAFTAFAITTLALGVGASTLVFSLVHTALVRTLPFHDPETLVWMYNARTERDRAPFSIPDLEDYRQGNSTLADLAVFTNWTANLTGVGSPVRLEGVRVSGNFFDLLGARSLLGRPLRPSDEASDARVAVLTCGLWKRMFGADPAVIGRTIALNGASYVIVGVLPVGFTFPFREAELAVPTTLRSDARRTDRGANFLRVVARLRAGVTIGRAKADLDAIAARLQRLYPKEDARKTGVNLYPLHAEMVKDYRQILWTLFAAVGLFLLVGCGNLANLIFVRATDRTVEFGIRASLGASRARIARLLAAEAAIIASLGGVLGVALAWMGMVAWRIFGPMNFPRREEVSLDLTVLAFALGASCVAALLCSVLPARGVLRGIGTTARGGFRGATGAHARIRRAFVAAQVGGSVLLLICMGLVARGFAQLGRVDVGFNPDDALTLQLSLPPRVYTDRATIERFADALRIQLASIPGVTDVGAVSLRPLSGLLSATDIALPDRPPPPPEEVPQAQFRVATAGYISAAGITLLAGREFAESDTGSSQPVAMVSRTLAERHWPGENAVGKHLQIVQSGPSPQIEIVGIVNDVKQFGADGAATADLYVPLSQVPSFQTPFLAARMYWVVRTRGDARAVGTRVREAVHSIDAEVATSSVQTMEDVLSGSLAGWRVNVRLLEAFAQLAVVLCAIGVYAVAANSAASRRRELAIRAAFGATRPGLVRLMLRDEMLPITMGLAMGVAAAFLIAPRLGTLLFRTSPSDPLTYTVATVAMFLVGIAATYIPARRAARSNPNDLLRA